MCKLVTRKKNLFGEYNYYFIFTNNNKKNERMMILEIIPEFKTQFCDAQRVHSLTSNVLKSQKYKCTELKEIC